MPIGDQLVATERERILALAEELERHGKLTAATLRTFAGMRLQVTQPIITVTHEVGGVGMDVVSTAKILPEPKVIKGVRVLGPCVHCGKDVSWDVHSVCYYHTDDQYGGYYCDATRKTSAEPQKPSSGQPATVEADTEGPT